MKTREFPPHLTYEQACALYPAGVPDVFMESPSTLDAPFYQRLALWLSARAAVQRMRYHTTPRETRLYGLSITAIVVDEVIDLAHGAPGTLK